MSINLLTVEEAARRLGMSRRYLNKIIKDGELRCICKTRCKRFIPVDDLARFQMERAGRQYRRRGPKPVRMENVLPPDGCTLVRGFFAALLYFADIAHAAGLVVDIEKIGSFMKVYAQRKNQRKNQ